MADKKVKTRIQNKHDTEENWGKLNTPPLAGEIIIYDKDSTHTKQRIKVGDGTTTVDELPFIVDKEDTDTKLNSAICGVAVSGREVTFTTVGGDTIPITTQDTDTNTKVTNTKNNTAKAYITGTTSSTTNTGTQVFDTNVYLDTTAGTLVATSFKGTATKATADGNGKTISSTYETKTDATAKVANMNKEAYLSWGGRSKSGSVGPLAAALSSDHNANRLAFLKPAALTFETSTDAGATWSAYSVSDADKLRFVTGPDTANNIKVGVGDYVTTNCRTRMTLCAYPYFYIKPRKLLLYVTQIHGMQVTLESQTVAQLDAGGTEWTTMGTYTLTGWSGWNEIDIASMYSFGSTASANNRYLRFTFEITTINSNTKYESSPNSLLNLRLFADTCWSSTSTMGLNGHLYSYDINKNATFPANVTATQFNGPATRLTATNVGSSLKPVYFKEGVPVEAARIPQIHTGSTAPTSALGENGDIYVMPYAHNIPAIYSGTAVPDHTIGVDGDIYIMY